ncbi:hypothetical protein BJ741DRAFT_601742 [Chytriomyces cf. hyalinus JEL632]|nr:hypothetical protein BJ741DRAFT_601742 [Chytriomyces cf. hyalinus JEL632]
MHSASNIIVLFKEGTAADVVEAAAQKVISDGGSIGHRYSTTMTGFAAIVPDSVLPALNDDVHIESIEADGEVSVLFKTKGN